MSLGLRATGSTDAVCVPVKYVHYMGARPMVRSGRCAIRLPNTRGLNRAKDRYLR